MICKKTIDNQNPPPPKKKIAVILFEKYVLQKMYDLQVPISGNSNKKQHRDPRQRSDKKGSEELSKILKAKTETERQEAEKAEKEALKQRAQSRSPTRQSPTSTSGLGSGGGNTPPPPTQETLSRNARSLLRFYSSYLCFCKIIVLSHLIFFLNFRPYFLSNYCLITLFFVIKTSFTYKPQKTLKDINVF